MVTRIAPAIMLLGLLHAVTAQPACSRGSPCKNNGTCEENAGLCTCPLGFGGASCEEFLTSACRMKTGLLQDGTLAAGICSHRDYEALKSCSCILQCRRFSSWGIGEASSRYCYERSVPDEEQTSSFPEPGEPNVKYYDRPDPDRNEMPWDKWYGDIVGRMSQAWATQDAPLPLSNCPSNCSYLGVCLSKGASYSLTPPFFTPSTPAECECVFGREGTDCSKEVPTACFNGCSNRGRCIRGFCSCETGFFGIDCSIDLLKANRTANPNPIVMFDQPERDKELRKLKRRDVQGPITPRHNTKLKIYIYELPTWLNLAYEIDKFQSYSEQANLYSAYIRAYSKLLHDWDVRTLDPYEANIFYVPAFLYGLLSNGGMPHDMVRRLTRFLQAPYPFFWDRFQGADHVFWYTGDRGVCPMPEDMAKYIWVSHYGQSNYTHSLDPNPTNVGPCFDAARHIVPPPVVRDVADKARVTYDNADGPARSILLFFAGGTRDQFPYYSQGVRQKVWDLFHNKSNVGLKIEKNVGDIWAEMRTSLFCLAPSGHGWGNRIVYAMTCGCIPIIIQDGIHQVFDDLLPYHEFSVRLPQRAIPDLEDILRSISAEEIRSLQHGVKKYHKAFFWPTSGERGGEGGQAYEFFIKSLEKRVYSVFSNFRHRSRQRSLGEGSEGGDGATKQAEMGGAASGPAAATAAKAVTAATAATAVTTTAAVTAEAVGEWESGASGEWAHGGDEGEGDGDDGELDGDLFWVYRNYLKRKEEAVRTVVSEKAAGWWGGGRRSGMARRREGGGSAPAEGQTAGAGGPPSAFSAAAAAAVVGGPAAAGGGGKPSAPALGLLQPRRGDHDR